MNRPLNSDPVQPLLEEALEDYLDYLCAPLLGVVPYPQRQRFRREAADHLLALAEDFAAEGFSPEDALSRALREYGEPWRLGQSFADSWHTGSSPRYSVRFADAATVRAFGCFGVCSVLCLLLMEQSVFQPLPAATSLIAVLAILSPFLAGVLTGLGLHARPGLGICRAVGTLAAASGVIGLLLLPHPEALQFALFQLAVWLPLGALSAVVTAALKRQHRLQHFSRIPR